MKLTGRLTQQGRSYTLHITRDDTNKTELLDTWVVVDRQTAIDTAKDVCRILGCEMLITDF